MTKKRLDSILLVGCILLLSLPCSAWFLVRLYRTTIQIPQERAEFEKQEASILAAIDAFRADHDVLPEHLSDLVPDYLSVLSLKCGDWSFQYGKGEDDRFALSSEAPSRWFGWPARRVCLSDPEESVACNYHYICGFRQGSTYLTASISPDQAQQNLFTITQTNPCTSSE